MDIKTVIAYQYKKIVLIALLIVVGFGFYKVYSSFFEKVNQIWQMKIGYDYANLIALAEQKLKNAQFQVEWSCSDFSLEDRHNESESCKQAKKELAKAKEEYEKLQAEKEKLFKIESQEGIFVRTIERDFSTFKIKISSGLTEVLCKLQSGYRITYFKCKTTFRLYFQRPGAVKKK
ncbi:MAG: hypothetical protein Q9M89_08205 [Persephonella sp.]|nr:hypothetical protein [Persephonella sp.]